ncbi:MAG: hypothetical protein APR63_05935 [Desulfuromonas sp. SDB]|nr:MAG: hypothetical protein APR63_05935 [Desulfuromonas sp. SDB]
MQRKTLGGLVVLLVITPSLLLSHIINVPQDQVTIQMGIDSAGVLDTVVVAPDTYHENIDFRGKCIVLTSNYMFTQNPQDIMGTVIDGSSPPVADSASTVRFWTGEDSFSVLTGFTITGGGGTKWIDPQYPSYTWRGGGGVFIYNSSPLIENNIIIGNEVTNMTGVSGAQGGGMITFGGNPVIRNNLITENQALYGAGVDINYSGCLVKNNIIYENSGGQTYGGAGIWTIGNSSDSIIIENNSIISNHSSGSGGYGGWGGGIFIWTSNLYLRNNIIWANTQTTGGPIAMINGGYAFASYNDIEGGFAGTGNIDENPCFEDSGFILTDSSGCVDWGNPAGEFNDPEDNQNPGFAQYPAKGSLTNDIGAYGGPWSQSIPIFTSGIEEQNPVIIYGENNLMEVIPRGNNYFLLKYSVFHRCPVKINIFRIDGCLADRIFNQIQDGGSYQINIDLNNLCPGSYILLMFTVYGKNSQKITILN